MKNIMHICLSLLFILPIQVQSKNIQDNSRVVSTIDSSHKNELVLIQKFTINAPIEKVWTAFTTKEGWESWAVPMAEIDWKVGGLIRTNYNIQGKIGDKNTIVNHIINYVPKKLITLQAELSPHFPEFMKNDAKDFYNVIYFSQIDDMKTTVESYGIGYKNTQKYKSLMGFFIPANEKTYLHLIEYLEKGTKVEYKSHE